jgi:acyl-CoA dehydrogenase
MLNITRLWNGVSSVALMRRGPGARRELCLAEVCFWRLCRRSRCTWTRLNACELRWKARSILCFAWRSWSEGKKRVIDEQQSRLLRLITPLMKLTTAKQAVAVSSEVLECFGGAGYVEDTGLPVLLRDSQVLPIWEGTTNVLALDALRLLCGDDGSLAALRNEIERSTEGVRDQNLLRAGVAAKRALGRAEAWLLKTTAEGKNALEAGARRLALTLGRSLELALLVQQAHWSFDNGGDELASRTAVRFANIGVDLITP